MPQSASPSLGYVVRNAKTGTTTVDLRHKRRELQGVNGAVGLAAGLAGYVGDVYSDGMATFLMFSIWIVGATLVILLTEPTRK